MKQDYFVVVLAHSLHGRLRRVHIPHKTVYGILVLAVFGVVSLFGFVSSYARMAWKVANYNSLKRETDAIRTRYEKLQKTVNETNQELATLQLFANEVSVAYGMKQKLEGSPDIVAEARLVPTFHESVEEYNYLRAGNLSRDGSWSKEINARHWKLNAMPSIWPVAGRLMGGYGERSDPFSGEGAYHTGVDISAPIGTSVMATADGVVAHSAFSGGYGRLVVLDHGNGYETYYAHLSRADVVEGQEIRRGEILGAVGRTGRSTGPHLHYEVRVGEAPVNPYRFLNRPVATQGAAVRTEFPF